MRRCSTLALGALAGVLLASCVRVTWQRVWTQTPIDELDIERLSPGEATLTTCLAELGAPLHVWEANQESYAIAYGWDKGRTWGVNVSVPVYEYLSAAVDYDNVDLNLYGVVFAFDLEDRLLWRREGFLREIAVGMERRRPAPVEQVEQSEETDELGG